MNQDRIKQRSYLYYHSMSEEQKREHIKSKSEYAKERFETQIKGTPKHIIMKDKLREYNERHREELRNKTKERYEKIKNSP